MNDTISLIFSGSKIPQTRILKDRVQKLLKRDQAAPGLYVLPLP